NLTGTSATIGWNTNENSAYQVVYGTSTSYGSFQTHAGFATSRSFALMGLLPGTTYHYKVTSWDAYGNLLSSGDLTFTTPGVDVTPPVESNVAASGITATGASIGWTTDEASDTQVEYGTTTAYGSSTTLNTALVTSHSANVSSLAASTTYHYRVKSHDAAGNLAVSGDFTFTTAAPADTTPPVISGISPSSVTSTGASIGWTTNEVSDTQVEYGTTTAYGSSTTLNTALVTSHSASLSSLAASTTYHYRVKSRDAAGNLQTSGDFTITTSAAARTTPHTTEIQS